jgi:hypothetical protein
VTIGGGYHPTSLPHPLTLADGDPVRLRGLSRLAFAVRMLYHVVDAHVPSGWVRWVVHIAGYAFTFYSGADEPLLAYHWHPEGRSPVTIPHLHLGASAVTPPLLATAHLTTGPVTLVDMADLAIRELGVQPLRSDWAGVLDGARVRLGE